MKENIIGVDVKDIYWHAEFAEVRRRTWNSIVFTLIYIKLFRIRRLRRSGMPCDGWRDGNGEMRKQKGEKINGERMSRITALWL